MNDEVLETLKECRAVLEYHQEHDLIEKINKLLDKKRIGCE